MLTTSQLKFIHRRRSYILVRRSVLRRTPRTVAPEAYWISLRIPFHFLSVSSNLWRSVRTLSDFSKTQAGKKQKLFQSTESTHLQTSFISFGTISSLSSRTIMAKPPTAKSEPACETRFKELRSWGNTSESDHLETHRGATQGGETGIMVEWTVVLIKL